MNIKNVMAQNAFWMVNKKIVDECGYVSAGMLSILIDKFTYYESRDQLYCGDWFYCTREQIEKDIKLSPYEQRSSEQILIERGFIEIKKMGVPGKNYYRVDQEKIMEFILELKHA